MRFVAARRRTAHLCLILALGGPLLGPSRAVTDLEHAAPGVIESQDEDDAESIDGLDLVATPASDPASSVPGLARTAWAEVPAFLHTLSLTTPGPEAGWERRWRPPWPPPAAGRQRALLQVFLF
jgi:hypothetical protein